MTPEKLEQWKNRIVETQQTQGRHPAMIIFNQLSYEEQQALRKVLPRETSRRMFAGYVRQSGSWW